MKLSKTQIELIEEMKIKIDLAREVKNFREWYWKMSMFASSKITFENCVETLNETTLEFYKNRFSELKEGLVLTSTSSGTLRALENKGLIEIIKDAGLGIDHIRLLNY